MPGLFERVGDFTEDVERAAEKASERVQNVAGDVRDIIARTEDAVTPDERQARPPLRTDESPDEQASAGLIERIGGLPVVGLLIFAAVLFTRQ